MENETPYVPLASGDEDVKGVPKAEPLETPVVAQGAVTAIPGVPVGTGFPVVHEVFHPAVTQAWDGMRALMKAWLAISILALVLSFPGGGAYGTFPNILGMVGASVYLCSCCQGGVVGVTRSRVNNLKVLSLIATIVSGVLGVIATVEMIFFIFDEPVVGIFFAFPSVFHLGHAAVSYMVCKRIWAVSNTMKLEENPGVEML